MVYVRGILSLALCVSMCVCVYACRDLGIKHNPDKPLLVGMQIRDIHETRKVSMCENTRQPGEEMRDLCLYA